MTLMGFVLWQRRSRINTQMHKHGDEFAHCKRGEERRRKTPLASLVHGIFIQFCSQFMQ